MADSDTPAKSPARDPRELGAHCDWCYLKTHRVGGPVFGEINPNAEMTVIGEAPGVDEVKHNRPFVGASGKELTQALAAQGAKRAQVTFLNTLLCQPPLNDLELALSKFDRENRAREKRKEPRWPSPMDCCKPRLQAELQAAGPAGKNIITVGGRAANVVLNRTGGVLGIRGGPVTLDEVGVKVMPTLHPAFIMRARRWTRAFRSDLGRAIRWFRGYAGWKAPSVKFQPTPAELRAYLRVVRPYAYDTETRPPLGGHREMMKDPLLAIPAIIGFYTEPPGQPELGEAMVVQLLRKDGVTRRYTTHEEAELIEIFREWGNDQRILKIDHNGYYDVPICKHNWGFSPSPRLDGIMVHRVVEPELPHGLSYTGSTFTEIPYAWKVDHAGSDPETDEEWCTYNALDNVILYRTIAPMLDSVRLRKQEVPLEKAHQVQKYCAGMHENGLWINPHARLEWDVKLREESVGHLARACTTLIATGMPEAAAKAFNPGSYNQLKILFFNTWNFRPVEFSKKTGEPSTGDLSLREFMRDKSISVPQHAFLEALRRFRASTKMRGYTRRLVPNTEVVHVDSLAADAEEEIDDEDDAQSAVADRYTPAKKKKKQVKGGKGVLKEVKYGLLHKDGRLHAHFNSHSVVTFRLSADTINVQNIPRRLRNMMMPYPGAEYLERARTEPAFLPVYDDDPK